MVSVTLHRPSSNTCRNFGYILPEFRQELCSQGIPEETQRWILVDAGQFVEYLEAYGIPLNAMSVEHIISYRDSLFNEIHSTKAPYKSTTVRRKMISTRKLIFFLFDRKAAFDETLFRPDLYHVSISEEKQQKGTLSVDDFRKIISLPGLTDAKGIRDTLILFLMMFRACSVHNISVLNLDHIYMDTGGITVLERSSKPRTFQLSVGALSLYKTWKSYRSMYAVDEKAVFVSLHSTDGRNQPGSHLSDRGIRQVVDHYLVAAGVKGPRICCQSLRDTCITLGLENGFSENEILSDILPLFNRNK